jgi:amino acid transporter
MSIKVVQFLAIIATALYLVPTGAHLFELPHKMALSPADYMTVQQIYAGWQLFGVAVGVALVAALANAIRVRTDRRALAWSLGAFLALAATQGAFWAFTYPVNIATQFWTVFPEQFEAARRQWEYSHAASAVLTFAALIAIVFSSLEWPAAIHGQAHDPLH